MGVYFLSFFSRFSSFLSLDGFAYPTVFPVYYVYPNTLDFIAYADMALWG